MKSALCANSQVVGNSHAVGKQFFRQKTGDRNRSKTISNKRFLKVSSAENLRHSIPKSFSCLLLKRHSHLYFPFRLNESRALFGHIFDILYSIHFIFSSSIFLTKKHLLTFQRFSEKELKSVKTAKVMCFRQKILGRGAVPKQ